MPSDNGDDLPLTAGPDRVLRERPHAIVATIMSDGRPQLTRNWFI